MALKTFLLIVVLSGSASLKNATLAGEQAQATRANTLLPVLVPVSVPVATVRQHLSDLGSYWGLDEPTFLASFASPGNGATLNWQQLSEQCTQSKLPFRAVRQSLSALEKRGMPFIARLQAPEEWVMVEAFGKNQTLIYRDRRDELIENKVLFSRYSGEALVHMSPVAAPKSGPILRLDNPVRTAPVTSIGGDSEIVEQMAVFNVGTAPLQLKVASTSCSCTGAQMSLDTVPPGKQGTLTIHMHASGSRLVTVNLRSNDPLRPNIIVALQSQMPDTKIVAPPPLVINAQIDQGATSETFIQLLPKAEIISTQSSLPFLSAVPQALMTGPAEAFATRKVAVQLSPQAPAGQFSGTVIFNLRNSPITKIILPVGGYVSDDIVAEPAMLQLGEAAVGSIVTQTVLLKAPKNKPFRIISATANDANIRSAIDSPTESVTHSVELKIPTGNEAGPLRKRITLQLSDGRVLDVDIIGKITTPVP